MNLKHLVLVLVGFSVGVSQVSLAAPLAISARPNVRLVFAVNPETPVKDSYEACLFSLVVGNFEDHRPGFCFQEDANGVVTYIPYSAQKVEQAARSGKIYVFDAAKNWSSASSLVQFRDQLLDAIVAAGKDLESAWFTRSTRDATRSFLPKSIFATLTSLLFPDAQAQVPSLVNGAIQIGGKLFGLIKERLPTFLSHVDNLIEESWGRYVQRYGFQIPIGPMAKEVLKKAVKEAGDEVPIIRVVGESAIAELRLNGDVPLVWIIPRL